MTNTERLYEAMKSFTDKRRQNREIFLQKKQRIETYRGSAGYERDISDALKIRKEADEAARNECRAVVDEVLADMVKKNSARTVESPTAEQIRLLTVAQMLKKPSKEVLNNIANSLGGNALALAALTDIAREAWKDEPNKVEIYIPSFEQKATAELSAGYVNDVIRALGSSCAEIMKGSGANRVREMGADRNARIYGGKYDPDELPQEKPYETEREFYKREAGNINFDLFAKAVN